MPRGNWTGKKQPKLQNRMVSLLKTLMKARMLPLTVSTRFPVSYVNVRLNMTGHNEVYVPDGTSDESLEDGHMATKRLNQPTMLRALSSLAQPIRQ